MYDSRLVHEVVIVLSDLYLPPTSEDPDGSLAGATPLTGFELAARYARRSAVAGGWRVWLTNALAPSGFDNAELLAASPASVAARALLPRRRPAEAHFPPHDAGATVWLATPVHLLAGLTNLHFDRRSILHLPTDQAEALAEEFARLFRDSGFFLEPLASGDFLLFGPSIPLPQTREPAKCIGEEVSEGLPRGPGSAPLRRLSAEVEMWLHEHPVNLTRRIQGELPVTTLWIWGGGPAPTGAGRLERAELDCVGQRDAPDAIFGKDAFLSGLCAGFAPSLPLPQQMDEVFGYSRARRAVLVLEAGEMLQSNSGWSFWDALGEIDRRFLTPTMDALRRNTLQRASILGNDRLLRLAAHDRLRFWRRAAPGLSGLR